MRIGRVFSWLALLAALPAGLGCLGVPCWPFNTVEGPLERRGKFEQRVQDIHLETKHIDAKP